jgi:hypothetical protein
MYSTILNLHHYISFIALLLLAVATLNGFIGTRTEKIFNETSRKINLFTLISCHVMLLLGLILLAVSPVAQEAFANMGAAMKNSVLRKAIIEHPFTNIIAVVLATIGNAKSKKLNSHGSKYKSSMIYFGLALVLILSRLPWEKIF